MALVTVATQTSGASATLPLRPLALSSPANTMKCGCSTKSAIRDVLLPLLDMPGIILPGKQRLAAVFDMYVERDVPFTTAYHVALMEHFEITEIASFDPTYDEIEGIQRVKL